MRTQITFVLTGLLAAIFSIGAVASAASVQGCLSGPTDEGVFLIKNKANPNGVEVGGNDELTKHLGHEVKLVGKWAKNGTEIGEKEEAGEHEEAGERHLKVTKIEMISTNCPGK